MPAAKSSGPTAAARCSGGEQAEASFAAAQRHIRAAMRIVLAVLLSFLLAETLSAQAQPRTIETVSWLQGCWISQTQVRVVEEQWTAPRARVMIGIGRTVRGDSMVEYELVLIRQRDTSLVYEAHPSGQPPATFTATFASDSSVVFENPMHDFPK